MINDGPIPLYKLQSMLHTYLNFLWCNTVAARLDCQSELWNDLRLCRFEVLKMVLMKIQVSWIFTSRKLCLDREGEYTTFRWKVCNWSPNDRALTLKKSNLQQYHCENLRFVIFEVVLVPMGVRGGLCDWGTALHSGRSRVRFPMVSLFIDLVLPAALRPWGRISF